MDRDALVARNQRLAHAFHETSTRHRVRQNLMHLVTRLPITPLRTNTRRILLIRPDHIGDVLLATPTVRAIKQANPYHEIHMLVGPWSAPVLSNFQEIDLVLTTPFPGFDRSETTEVNNHILHPYQQLVKVSRQLRRIEYQSAVILRPDHWWGAMLAYLAGIEQIIGYDLETVEPFLTEKIPFEQDHVIMQNLRLVQQWTEISSRDDVALHFPVFDNDREMIRDYLQRHDFTAETRYLCIHPGSGTWVKQWAEENWAKVADILAEQLEVKIILTGSRGERPLCSRIRDQMTQSAIIMAGDTDLNQLAALFEKAEVVLGVDSGAIHIASAVGTPTVALFGPADTIEFGTWGDSNKHIVLTSGIACRPCRVLDWTTDNPIFHPCLTDIDFNDVLSAARRAASYRRESI